MKGRVFQSTIILALLLVTLAGCQSLSAINDLRCTGFRCALADGDSALGAASSVVADLVESGVISKAEGKARIADIRHGHELVGEAEASYAIYEQVQSEPDPSLTDIQRASAELANYQRLLSEAQAIVLRVQARGE